jgi:predicted translin family RNA/ssDNA-binding protein
MKLIALACCLAIAGTLSVHAEDTKDTRTLVELPNYIKEKTVVIMRDHVRALDDIIDAVQTGKFDKAESIVESRLSWSSPLRHEDQEVIKHWPEPMQKMADQLYHAATNYVVVSRDVAVEESKGSYKKINAALGELSSACRACHEAYRLR